MDREATRHLLEHVASDPQAVGLLRTQPEALGEALGLTDDQIAALRSADVLAQAGRR